MSKKSRAGKSSYTSKGTVGSTRTRTSYGMTRLLNQRRAWEQGKRVMVSVDGGPKVEAQQIWGLPPFMKRKEANGS